MKCVQSVHKSRDVRRVSDEEAAKLTEIKYDNGRPYREFHYISKERYRAAKKLAEK